MTVRLGSGKEDLFLSMACQEALNTRENLEAILQAIGQEI